MSAKGRKQRLEARIRELEWDVSTLRGERDAAILAATMDLRERLAVREEQVKRLRRAIHAFASTLGGAQNAARRAAHVPFEDVRRELREDNARAF